MQKWINYSGRIYEQEIEDQIAVWDLSEGLWRALEDLPPGDIRDFVEEMLEFNHKLDPEDKAAWVAALLSGQYVQGTGHLRVYKDVGVSQFCCLGVRCDLKDPMRWFAQPTDVWSGCKEWVWLNHSGSSLNAKLISMSKGATGLTHNQESILAGLNDGGATFVQIAEFIEATF